MTNSSSNAREREIDKRNNGPLAVNLEVENVLVKNAAIECPIYFNWKKSKRRLNLLGLPTEKKAND